LHADLLRVLYHLPLLAHGGAERNVYDLARRMSTGGRRRACSGFDVTRVVDEHEDLNRELLGDAIS
jgi:hypothetical protein